MPHTPEFCMPTFGNGRNNSKTACICLYRVRFPKLENPGKLALLHLRLFPDPFQIMQRSVAEKWEREPAYVASKVCQLEWLRGPISACALSCVLQSPARVFVLLSMLSGEICLGLKPYLVVEISSDIVTEHCCQLYVLSMMFCCSDCRLCGDCAIKKLLAVSRVLTTRQANVGYEKYSLPLTFTFYLNRDTSVLELSPVVVSHL